jgi:uncharacterized repeat protein (TIGR03803 family)
MNLLREWKIALSLFAVFIATAIAVPAQTVTSVASGFYATGPVVQGFDGNLYASDQTDCTVKGQGGRIVKVTPEGTVSTVYTFVGEDGKCPSGLALETNGNLYGTTLEGGAPQASCETPAVGCGTVFELTPAGVHKTLFSFNGVNGYNPMALTLGPDGSTFYGVTGGPPYTITKGPAFGTIFEITPTGTYTLLHTFSNTDGSIPSPLVLGTDGNLYGTTEGGGTYNGGTVFKITPGGTFTTLYNFNPATEGNTPNGALVQGPDGNFYGTNLEGGATCDSDVTNNGTIFAISPGGHIFRTVYDFAEDCFKASTPFGGLTLGTDGNFYGVASGLNSYSTYFPDGILFELTPTGDLTTLYTFGYPDESTLMQYTNGTFYGTNQFCDYKTCPSLYSLTNSLGPFVTAVPALRGIGAKVLLLGQGFTGATSVTFNGVEATFTVNSDTEITTTVPTGATKGYIVVTTPGGTVSTKVFFTVG